MSEAPQLRVPEAEGRVSELRLRLLGLFADFHPMRRLLPC